MKYFSYYRVSSKGQERDGVSLDAQREAIVAYANSHSLVIAKEFREVQSASKIAKRKKFYEMIGDLESRNDIAGIIFHDVDRSSRNFRDWAIISNLMDEGLEIHLSRENIQLKSNGDRLMADVKAVMAVNDTRVLSTRVKEGMYKRLSQGYSPFGNVPTGYVKGGKSIRVVDPIMGPLISECFKLYATGEYSLLDLETIMFNKGLRSSFGNKMRYTKLCTLLNNKYYLGFVTVKGQIFQGQHQPLVSEELYSKVQAVKKRHAIPKLQVNEYKFVHILSCGLCGKRLRSTTSKHKYHYYYCRNKLCSMKPIKEELVETWILDELTKIRFTPDQVDEMIEQAHKTKKSLALAMIQKKESIVLQIGQARLRLSKLIDKNIDGEIPRDMFDLKRAEYAKNIAELESELQRINPNDDGGLNHKLELASLLGDPVHAYQQANGEQKRRLIDSLLKNIRVTPDGVDYDDELQFIKKGYSQSH
ncbi:MAG: recombinase family protein [Patescibacteria group bacterium]